MNITYSKTDAQMQRITRTRVECFRKMRELSLEDDVEFLYVDEVIFTAGQVRPKVWYTRGHPLEIEKKRLAFKAIAVVGATDVEGRLVARIARDSIITKEDFMDFMEEVSVKSTRGKVTYLFIDNLPMHHMYVIKDKAKYLGLGLVYNGTYSSEFNPIEILWANAKRKFSTRCIVDAPYQN